MILMIRHHPWHIMSFLKDCIVRWCHVDGVGIKLNYSDFRRAWVMSTSPTIIIMKTTEEETKMIREEVTQEVFHSKKPDKRDPALTFEQCCRLICLWFPDPQDAMQQIARLSKLMSKSHLAECGIFLHEEGKTPTKRMREELSFKHISKVARNKSLLKAYVAGHHPSATPQVAFVLLEPLEMPGIGKTFRRVEVPGRGNMLFTYDVILGLNRNKTVNAAGCWFRVLPEPKLKEASCPFAYAIIIGCCRPAPSEF